MNTNSWFYDENATFYESHWGLDLHFGLFVDDSETLVDATRRTNEHMLKALHLSNESILLDVGCGRGGLINLITRCSKAKAVGIDIHPVPLRSAVTSGLAVVSATAEILPFPPRTFSHIVVFDAFYLFHDPDAVLREFQRVGAPGCRLIISDLLRGTQIRESVAQYFELQHRARSFDTEDVRHSRMREAGWEPVLICDRTEQLARSYRALIKEASHVIDPERLRLFYDCANAAEHRELRWVWTTCELRG